jgi:3-oxoadipate enol-lactonase
MFARLHDKQIYYETHGDGFPLVLLNGIMMSTRSWTPFIEALSKHHRLILLDFLDQGQSDKMSESYDHSIQVDAIFAVLDDLKIETADLVGISYGAQIALQAALKAPKRIRRLVIANAGIATAKLLAEIGRGWNHVAGEGEAYYYATIPTIYSPRFYADHLEWMENRKKQLIQIFSDPDFAAAMVRLTNSSESYNIEAEAERIEQPTLVIGSDSDVLTPLSEQRRLVAALPDAELVIIPDCGHASMYEKPALFTSLVLGHLAHDQRSFAI